MKVLRGTSKLSVDEFLREFADVDDGNSHELQDGEVFVAPPPGSAHSELHALVVGLLSIYSGEHAGLRVFDACAIQFAPDTLRAPDVTVVLPGDGVKMSQAALVGTPSLVIEIVSPNKPRLDLVVKRGLFTTVGIPEIWFIDAETREALFLNKLRTGKYTEQKVASGSFHSKVLKGLTLDVTALFDLDKKRLFKSR